METSQPSFPPSSPSPRTKGEDGWRDRNRKITYVSNTGGWGVLCHLVGWQDQAQLQPPREGGDPREEGSLGRRLHCPELPQLPTHRSQGTEHGQQGCVGAVPWGPGHQGARRQVLTSVSAGKGLEMSPRERGETGYLSCTINLRVLPSGPKPSEASLTWRAVLRTETEMEEGSGHRRAWPTLPLPARLAVSPHPATGLWATARAAPHHPLPSEGKPAEPSAARGAVKM